MSTGGRGAWKENNADILAHRLVASTAIGITIQCNVILLQCTLHSNGDIVFVYVTVPDLLSADALYDDEPVAGKTIFQYIRKYFTLNSQN